jgi:hypothetical protein
MHDSLRLDGLIPLVEPYTAAGFTMAGGSGTSVPAARLTETGPNAVVDWVLVELRNKNDPAQIQATRPALLERDGDVVGVDGYRRLIFSLPADQYFVAVRHRNHLGAMTATAITLGADEIALDFTLATTPTHGAEAQFALTGSRRALWAGNAVRDNKVLYTNTNNDRDAVLNQVGGVVPTATVTGYLNADLNLDGVVRYTGGNNDRDLILQNIGGVVPTLIRNEQLP